MLERYIPWKQNEKPCLNHWYRCKDCDRDYYQIRKDYFDEDRNMTLYKIVEYYNGDNLYVGSTLAEARQLIREHTYRMVI